MPHSNVGTGDFAKLQLAFAEITSTFGSVDNLLEALGLATLPTAHRYGILFGCLVFTFTVVTVLTLLTLGGSFKRIAEQAETGKSTVASDFRARLERPLLLERLLDARERLLENYPSRPSRKEVRTRLTQMLLNVSPPKDAEVPKIVDDNDAKRAVIQKEARAEFMTGFKENFVVAYRKCQDKPGGPILSGRPEARYEAFARAYAGCGDHVSLSYRRSYARMYESICCESHQTDDQYNALYLKDPETIVGKWVRLEALDSKRHLKYVYAATSGDMYFYKKSYDSSQVWGFLPDGPFDGPKELQNSFVFQHYDNQGAFAIVQSLTDRVLGVVMLSNDDPANLSIQLDPPIIGPFNFGGKEQLESCFLLMDRLFAHGYRRIQISVDAKDGQGTKLSDRLGFTFEGCLLRDQIVKESSRDSNIYGILNSDWDKGARTALYAKLYGVAMARADVAYNKKEEETDEQQRALAEQKLAEELKKEHNG